MTVVRQRISTIRESIGLSKEELALRSGLAVSTIYDIEDGFKQPKLSTLQRIADALMVRLEYLITGLGPPRRLPEKPESQQ